MLPWFDDAETRRWLGGRAWPRQALRLAASPGRRLLGIWRPDRLVGLIDAEDDGVGGVCFAIVVDPTVRGCAIATAAIAAFADQSRQRDIKCIRAGVERDNVASEALLCRCGFLTLGGHDADGFRTYQRVLTHEGHGGVCR